MIDIAGVKFKSYIMNSAGALDETLEQLKTIGESYSAAIVMKSCTSEPRKGNEEPRIAFLPYGIIQSMGLPNLGCKKYIEFIDELKKYNKPIIASVAGLSLEEYKTSVKTFQDSSIDLIEINLSCPNIKGKDTIAYDFKLMEKFLFLVNELGDKPIGLKLPPYFANTQFNKASQIIKKYDISFVTTINSLPNALAIDLKTESTLIRPNNGFGGLSGKYIKPIALANVRKFYENLDVPVIGVGGISTGEDVFEFLLAGATVVQVGTQFIKEGVNCFKRLNDEFESILKEKNYSIEEAKGKLKYLW